MNRNVSVVKIPLLTLIVQQTAEYWDEVSSDGCSLRGNGMPLEAPLREKQDNASLGYRKAGPLSQTADCSS